MLPATTLRPARAFAVRVKPAMIATCSANAASFSTSTRPTKAQPTNRSSFACKNISPIRTTARCASTSTGAPTVGSTVPPSSTSTQLTWNDFLALRKTRRKINVATSGVSAVAVTYAGLQAFISQGYDSTLSASVGLDPLMVTGLSTIGMIAVGWLLGPFFGNAIFNVRYRSIRGEIERKEREFYNRIKSHRVDPTSSSMANPVPDYYGEKIGSVADYRRWLKDQRAFNLKRGAYQGGK